MRYRITLDNSFQSLGNYTLVNLRYLADLCIVTIRSRDTKRFDKASDRRSLSRTDSCHPLPPRWGMICHTLRRLFVGNRQPSALLDSPRVALIARKGSRDCRKRDRVS